MMEDSEDFDSFEDFDEDRDPYSDEMSYDSDMYGMGFGGPFWL
jgi:hypothetical protein